MRVPRRDGQTLDLPAHEEVAALLRNNIALRQSPISAAKEFPLKDLQTRARAEAIELAVNWSNQYLPVEARVDANSFDPSSPIIFGGHSDFVSPRRLVQELPSAPNRARLGRHGDQHGRRQRSVRRCIDQVPSKK